MPPSTVPTCAIASDRVAGRGVRRKNFANRAARVSHLTGAMRVVVSSFSTSQEQSHDPARDRQNIQHSMMKEAQMRFCLLILAVILAAAPAVACPTGYVPCGAGNALCCR